MLYPLDDSNCDNDRMKIDVDAMHNGRSIAKELNGSSGAASSIHPAGSPIGRTEMFRRMMQHSTSRIRHIVVLLLTKVTSKEWLSVNHWIIHVVVWFATLTLLLLFAYVTFFLVIKKIIWVYQHSECYSREGTIVWEEGKPHNMSRHCPPITQYRTMLQENQRPGQADRSKICITTLSDTKQRKTIIRCRNFDEVARYTLPNHYSYGIKHGYTVIDQSILLDNTRPPAWSKIRAVQAMLTSYECEWVLWLDADIVIMNSSIPLESIIPNQDFNENAAINLIVTTDRRFTANSGAWLIRNSEWSKQFLRDWWNLKSYVRPSGLSLSGDNDAFGYMVRKHLHLGDESVTRDTIKYDVESSSPSQHIRMIARCTMNSFGVFVPSKVATAEARTPPSDITKEEWYIHPDQWYYSGDFIAHASGIDQKDAGIKLLLARAV
jgi:hypothetical protein